MLTSLMNGPLSLYFRKYGDIFWNLFLAAKDLSKVAREMIYDSSGGVHVLWDRVEKCLIALRQECIKREKSGIFNSCISKFKNATTHAARSPNNAEYFWGEIVISMQIFFVDN
jgi:hypothetical protein